MQQYLDLIRHIQANGVTKPTEQVPEPKCFWLPNALRPFQGFPMVTTKIAP